MKKFACVMITTLAIGSVLTACSEEKEETKVETNSQLDISNSLKKDCSGVDTSTKVTLDGEAISLPNDTSSAKLKPGEHTLSIETTDIVGNTSIKTIVFSTATEMPNAPEILSPVEGSTLEDTDADLKVKVTDPTADKMKVQLYEGFKYLPKDDNDGQTRSYVQLFTTGTKSGNGQGGSNSSSNGNNSEQKDNKVKN